MLDEYRIGAFVANSAPEIPHLPSWLPWQLTERTEALLRQHREDFTDDYLDEGDLVRHRSAQLDPTVVIDGPVVAGPNVSVGPNTVLRAGVFLGAGVRIGPSCEIKTSWIFADAAVAHLSYVGNSVIGSDVNLEAGVVLANHFNERTDKRIFVAAAVVPHDTGVTKFGALIGDGSRLGANAVTTPGTVLAPGTIVGRLQLVDQLSSPR